MASHKRFLWIIILSLIVPASVLAHTGEGVTGGLMSGFMHPVAGLDHVTAMVAVGILGAFLGKPAIWVLPVVFPLVMAFGGVLGLIGVPIPFIEAGIAASSIVLGLMILFALKPPLWIAAVIVAAFSIFHGHAHGTEMPYLAKPLLYACGFVTGTGIIHIAGVMVGMTAKQFKNGTQILRYLGAGIAGIGFYLIILL